MPSIIAPQSVHSKEVLWYKQSIESSLADGAALDDDLLIVSCAMLAPAIVRLWSIRGGNLTLVPGLTIVRRNFLL